MRKLILTALVLNLTACSDNNSESENGVPTRGLKTILINEHEDNEIRRYPSVLQPAETSVLAFEIAGQLGEVSLEVGQKVEKGAVLAEIDPKSLEIQLESAKAGLTQAQATEKNASDNLDRQRQLFERGVVTKAVVDDADTQAQTAQAQVLQAQKQVESAEEDLTKSKLVAPYSGVINTVEVESFANVSPGNPVVTLYDAGGFEVSLSVSYEVNTNLVVGKRATVRLADNPGIVLNGQVSELGARADTVSSFPVVVKLSDTDPSLKAGMAVEVSFEFAVGTDGGYLLPLSSAATQNAEQDKLREAGEASKMNIFVYDPDSSTVKAREVTVAGIRNNSLIVVDGLKPGERVASAGVPFLHDGMKVKLLPDATN